MSKDKANERISSREAIQRTKKSHSGVLAVIVLIVILLLIGVIVFLVTKEEPAKEYNTVVTPENVDQIISQLEEEEYTPVGYYTATMRPSWTFPSGDEASTNAFVENRANNQNTVYFTVSPRSDSNTIWYTSPYIAIGGRLDNIKLDVDLEAGEYDTVITYHLVDEEYNEISSVAFSLPITIEN